MELGPAEEMAWLLCWLKRTHRRSKAAVAGGIQLRRKEGSVCRGDASGRKSRRLSLAEGRRGAQERNFISSSFSSFISGSFQGDS